MNTILRVALLLLFAINVNAQFSVTHFSGTVIPTGSGRSVTVTSSGAVSSSTYCTAGPYWIGTGGTGSAPLPGSYTYSFTPAVKSVQLIFTGMDNFGGDTEKVRFDVNGIFYPISVSHFTPYLTPCNQCPATINGGWLFGGSGLGCGSGFGGQIDISSCPINSITVYTNGVMNGNVYSFRFDTGTVVGTPISGPSTVCSGSSISLSNATSGGTWTSSTPSVAIVNYSSGVVTGVGAGTATITYTVSGLCGGGFVTQAVTVDASPPVSPVTGPTNVCPGNTITLADATLGGTWSSSNPAIATVGSTGIVTGVSAGNVIISYAVTGGGCTGYAMTKIIVGHNIITTIAGTGIAVGLSPDGVPATSALVSRPNSIETDATGNIYFVDKNNQVIRKIDPAGIIVTIAGTGTTGSGADGVAATSSSLNQPFALALDGSGNIYVTDEMNNRVRKIDVSGIITTIAGTGTAGFFGDGGPATAAQLNRPRGIDVDASGNIFVAEWLGNRVRRIAPDGIITTFAGTGTGFPVTGEGIAATASNISNPNYVKVAPNGNVVISDQGSVRLRAVNSSGIIYTVAGNLTSGYSGDGGPATTALINQAGGMAFDGAGNMYFADNANQRIRKVDASGTIYTYAGIGTAGFFGDGGPATAARLNSPADVAFDLNGNLLIADIAAIRKTSPIDPLTVAAISGVSTVCQGVPALYTDATPGGIWSSSNAGVVSVGPLSGVITGAGAGPATITYTVQYTCGELFVTKDVTVNAFSAGVISGPSIVCPGNTISLTDPWGGGTWSSSNPAVAAVNSSGVVTGIALGYTAISYTITNSCGTLAARSLITVGNPIINTIAGTGTPGFLGQGTPATAAQMQGPHGMVMDGAGNLYFCDYNNSRIRKIDPAGIITTVAGTGSLGYSGDGFAATAAQLRNPSSVALDPAGNIIFTDYNNNAVRKINTAGIISTIAGTGTAGFLGDGGPATAARLNHAPAVITDAVGNIYVSDASNHRVRKIDASGIITTIAGNGTSGFNSDDLPATQTSFSNPYGLAFDNSGNLYVADQTNFRIRKINIFGIVSTVLGTGTAGTSPDGTPATATSATLPTSVFFDAAGNLNYTDRTRHCVRQVNSGTGLVTTLVNTTMTAGFAGDGGAPATARLNNVPFVYIDAAGNMYLPDFNNNRIRKVSPVSRALAAISGASSVCIGTTIILTDATPGGTWSSSNLSVATVGTSGIVTGISGGTADISYSVTYACGVVSVTQTITVNALPAITGTPSVCAGATTTLSNATSGGTWSSGAPGTATVGSGSGDVTGVSPGIATITYTSGSGCIATIDVTVNTLPAAITPGGPVSVCAGATTTLVNATPGGTWSSGATSVATVGTSGVVTGVLAGTATISYSTGAGCSVTKDITVNVSPAAISPSSAAVCVGNTTILTNSIGGGVWSSSAAGTASVSGGTVTGVAAGAATISYSIGLCSSTAPVTVNASPASITPGTPVAICVGATSALGNATPGGTWSSGTTSVATVGTGGLVTGVSAGTATISYTTASGCSAIKTVTVNITPAAMSPLSAAVCAGSTTTFTNATGGGTWSSSAAGTASVAGGVVTGISAGTATISYTIGSCFATAPVTVNATPAAITPAVAPGICVGAATTLADATPGGTWSSGATGIAAVGTSGIVTGISAGTATISYTNAAGCFVTRTVTVNVTPAGISPSSTTVCTGNTVTLTDAVGGGVWSSAATGVASVAGGVVTGVMVGTATISYTIGSCFSTASVTVNLSPNAGAITGPSSICIGTPATFTDPAPGGVWSSSDISVATVSSGGVVSGVSAGTATISYSVTNGCGTVSAIAPITVNASAVAGTISGLSMMCAGTFTTLVSSAPGGVWSASNGNASISSTGILTGITPGIDTIYYTVSNACGPVSARHIVTIGLYLSAGTISGPSGVCTGSSITLTDPVPSGTWSASNANATVTTGGIVTGVSGGTVTISYTVAASCGSASATRLITVTPTPDAGVISGPMILCVGMTSMYTTTGTGGVWGVTNPTASILLGGLVTALSVGIDTITYTVTNVCGTSTASIGLNIGPGISAGSISGPSNVCEGASVTLTNPATGGTWSASNTNATVTAGGVVSGVTAGAVTISYTVTSSCGSVSATAMLTVDPLPNAGTITGASAVCVGSAVTLADAAPGGVWSASNGNATVSTGGVVTGVTAGTVDISYTVTTACGTAWAISTITVSNAPSAGTITGPGTVCESATITLADATPGGTWSASNTNATVTMGGVVTGMAAGTVTISYTVSGSCGTASATALITVDPLPNAGAISGPTDVCVASTITLTDPVGGGTWSASNANATVSGGVVTGVTAGTVTISYTVTNGCGTASAISITTVNPLPDAGAITGGSNVCTGAMLVLTSTAPGGVWSASNSNATVSGGIVTGVMPGMDTISYTVSNSCGIATASVVVTIGAVPTVAAITGPSTVCKTSSISLADATADGVWTASNARATVSATGLVTGVTAGADTIRYTVTNACGAASAMKIITVMQAPSPGTISGASSVCVGLTISLLDAAPGGSWSSSNPAAASVSAAGMVSGLSPGTATINYTVSNSCGSRAATHTVAVLSHADCNVLVNGPGSQPRSELKVYPNPNQGSFNMNLLSDNDEPVTVVITNIIGVKIKEFTTTTNKVNDIRLNTAPGIYLLTAITGNSRYITKVTVE